MQQKAHTFTKFDDDLNSIRAHILEMGKLVESQFSQSLLAFFEANTAIAHQVVDQDYSVDQMEMRIDSLCVIAIARQQPAACDLQSIIISTKIVMLLEHVGDEAKKIALIVEQLARQKLMTSPHIQGIRLAAQLAQQKLAEVIDSFARLDSFTAYKLLGSEDLINEMFNNISRDLIQSMTDDPRTISSSLAILFVAKAIERIGNNIKDISKLVIDASNRYGEI
ncbi:MAG: phosphate signaling complex protein PhoU [Gammaproteobacteria bacterium]|nr:phosphate signaling complex protein PhoU [Gammaproteobacteria bacterium]MBU1481720.1 phosphate signaling complex protein PhoU [Gammaproteobacteria bacterium]